MFYFNGNHLYLVNWLANKQYCKPIELLLPHDARCQNHLHLTANIIRYLMTSVTSQQWSYRHIYDDGSVFSALLLSAANFNKTKLLLFSCSLRGGKAKALIVLLFIEGYRLYRGATFLLYNVCVYRRGLGLQGPLNEIKNIGAATVNTMCCVSDCINRPVVIGHYWYSLSHILQSTVCTFRSSSHLKWVFCCMPTMSLPCM